MALVVALPPVQRDQALSSYEGFRAYLTAAVPDPYISNTYRWPADPESVLRIATARVEHARPADLPRLLAGALMVSAPEALAELAKTVKSDSASVGAWVLRNAPMLSVVDAAELVVMETTNPNDSGAELTLSTLQTLTELMRALELKITSVPVSDAYALRSSGKLGRLVSELTNAVAETYDPSEDAPLAQLGEFDSDAEFEYSRSILREFSRRLACVRLLLAWIDTALLVTPVDSSDIRASSPLDYVAALHAVLDKPESGNGVTTAAHTWLRRAIPRLFAFKTTSAWYANRLVRQSPAVVSSDDRGVEARAAALFCLLHYMGPGVPAATNNHFTEAERQAAFAFAITHYTSARAHGFLLTHSEPEWVEEWTVPLLDTTADTGRYLYTTLGRSPVARLITEEPVLHARIARLLRDGNHAAYLACVPYKERARPLRAVAGGVLKPLPTGAVLLQGDVAAKALADALVSDWLRSMWLTDLLARQVFVEAVSREQDSDAKRLLLAALALIPLASGTSSVGSKAPRRTAQAGGKGPLYSTQYMSPNASFDEDDSLSEYQEEDSDRFTPVSIDDVEI